MKNGLMEATFHNPYDSKKSVSWYYGFMFRAGGDKAHLVIVWYAGAWAHYVTHALSDWDWRLLVPCPAIFDKYKKVYD